MIPFAAGQPSQYRVVELTPPGVSSQSSPKFPGAQQVLPRTPGEASGTRQEPSQSAPANLPPLPSLAELPQVTGNNSPSESASGTTGNGSLVSFQSAPSALDPNSPIRVLADFAAGQVVAIVGTERILAGDLAAVIEPIIIENKNRLNGQAQEDVARRTLLRQVLPQFVEMKALEQEFFRDMAGTATPDEVKKMREQVVSRATRMFYDRYVPAELFKKYKVEGLAELEAELQNRGMSLGIMKNHFLTQVMGSQLEEKYVLEQYEIPPDEILAYYQENIDRWKVPARAKWRQLTVRHDRHATREEALQRIEQLFNEVYLGGKPFEAVARDSSEGYTAAEGGLYDWTSQKSLKSAALDQAIFSLPLRHLSQLIEDDIGFHVVEVVQREDARTQDMAEIQTEIRKTLSKAIRQKKADEFRKKILVRVPVWTRWPEDIPGSRPLEEALGE
jgi:parvulin-like peptidyl-prolyl isomerase